MKQKYMFFSGFPVLLLWSSSGFSAFSKSSFSIWKFLVHVLIKCSLKVFEHNFESLLNECNCSVVRTFFGIAFLWDLNENWPFPVLWPLLPHFTFYNMLIECAHWSTILITGRGTRDQMANICWIMEKAREFQKNIYFCFIDLCQSFWLCGSQ